MLDPQSVPFFELPFEIRSQIYNCLVEDEIVLHWVNEPNQNRDNYNTEEKNAQDDASKNEHLLSSEPHLSHWAVDTDGKDLFSNSVPSYAWIFTCRTIYHEVAPRFYRKMRLEFSCMTPDPICRALSLLSHEYRSLVRSANVGKLWLSEPPTWETQRFKQQHYEREAWPVEDPNHSQDSCPWKWRKGDNELMWVMRLLFELLPGLKRLEIGVAVFGFWETGGDMCHTAEQAVILLGLLIDPEIPGQKLGKAASEFWAESPSRGRPSRRVIMERHFGQCDVIKDSSYGSSIEGRKALEVHLCQGTLICRSDDPVGWELWHEVWHEIEAYQRRLATERERFDDGKGETCIVVSFTSHFPPALVSRKPAHFRHVGHSACRCHSKVL